MEDRAQGSGGAAPAPALRAVSRALVRSREAEAKLRLCVEEATQKGATWEQVAYVLGVSKQAAWKRFGSTKR